MHRILIVDDETLVADTLGLIFRKHGFEARVAYSAAAALASARSFQPELLLCDITMPERTGLDLMADLHRELPECHFLVLTGYNSNVLRVGEQAARLRRPMRVLTKPCNPEQLLAEVGRVLRGPGQLRASA
jgi:DNA-binding response OmpR family regulator